MLYSWSNNIYKHLLCFTCLVKSLYLEKSNNPSPAFTEGLNFITGNCFCLLLFLLQSTITIVRHLDKNAHNKIWKLSAILGLKAMASQCQLYCLTSRFLCTPNWKPVPMNGDCVDYNGICQKALHLDWSISIFFQADILFIL